MRSACFSMVRDSGPDLICLPVSWTPERADFLSCFSIHAESGLWFTSVWDPLRWEGGLSHRHSPPTYEGPSVGQMNRRKPVPAFGKQNIWTLVRRVDILPHIIDFANATGGQRERERVEGREKDRGEVGERVIGISVIFGPIIRRRRTLELHGPLTTCPRGMR